jgi:hypothetical protein
MIDALIDLGCSWKTSARFSDLSIARNAVRFVCGAGSIIRGNDGLFWVVSLTDACKLVNAGYEVV